MGEGQWQGGRGLQGAGCKGVTISDNGITAVTGMQGKGKGQGVVAGCCKVSTRVKYGTG
jgi:hypothetical protein